MKILCEVSVRHVHLCQEDVEALFGEGIELEFFRELSQPGQYLSKQRVSLVTPKATFDAVAVLGPTRRESQVELSRTDCFALGLKSVPLRLSGELESTPGIVLRNGDKEVTLTRGVIVAKRHVHLDVATAKKYGFKNNDIVKVTFEGERGGMFDKVQVRVDPNFSPAVHIDTDEGNAMFFGCGEVLLEAGD